MIICFDKYVAVYLHQLFVNSIIYRMAYLVPFYEVHTMQTYIRQQYMLF